MCDTRLAQFGGDMKRFELARFVPLLMCALGIFVVFGPMLASRLELTHGGLADGRLINYVLEHGYRWLTQTAPHEQFWNTPLFHPHPGVTTYTDVLVASGPPYWLARALGAPPDTSFQLWMLVVWSGNYALAYLMLRRGVGVGRTAAALGAWLFAFGGIQRIRFRHQQLVVLPYVLLAATGLCVAFQQRRSRRERQVWIGVFFVAVALQLYTAFYPFFFYGSLLAAFAAWGLLLDPSRRRLFALINEHGRWIAACAVACVLAVAPLAAQYQRSADEVGGRSHEQFEQNVPRVSSWLLMGEGHPLYGSLARSGVLGPGATDKHANGLGLVTLPLAAFGLWNGRRRPGVCLLVLATATVFAVFTRHA